MLAENKNARGGWLGGRLLDTKKSQLSPGGPFVMYETVPVEIGMAIVLRVCVYGFIQFMLSNWLLGRNGFFAIGMLYFWRRKIRIARHRSMLLSKDTQ